MGMGVWRPLTRVAATVAMVAGVGLVTAAETADTAVASAPPRDPAVASVTAPKTVSLMALTWDQVPTMGDVTRYRSVIMMNWHHDVVASIHATSPSTQVLAYLDGAATSYKDTCPATVTDSIPATENPTPIDYCWVLRNQPGWLLRDKAGQPIRFADFPEYAAMDVSNQDFRNLWISNALKIAASGSFDGVFFDDGSLRVVHGMSGRIGSMTDAQYGQAMAAFISQYGDALKAQGLTSMVNLGINAWEPTDLDLATGVAAHVSVVNHEFWSRWGAYCATPQTRFTDPASDGNPTLTSMLEMQRRLQAAGAGVSAMDYGSNTATADDEATMRYGRATFLLSWNGLAGSSYFYRSCGAGDPSSPNWTRELGTPTTGQVTTPEGAYRRDFTLGLVLVNPHASGSLTVRLPSGTFADTQGRTVRGKVTIAARDAALLLRK